MNKFSLSDLPLLKTKPVPKKGDGRAVAQLNEIKILKALRLFGHLRRTEIAAAVWPKSSASSAYQMTCRTLNRMLDAGLVLSRPNLIGEQSFILASKGVNKLQDYGLRAAEGYDLAVSGPQFLHRTLATSYLLEKARAGFTVISEHALAKNFTPLSKRYISDTFEKLPDGLVQLPGGSYGYAKDIVPYDWVEVESAYKPYEEVKKALKLMSEASTALNKEGDAVVHQLVFVYDQRLHHELHLLRCIDRYIKEESKNPALASEIVMASCNIKMPFVWLGMKEELASTLLAKYKSQATASTITEQD